MFTPIGLFQDVPCPEPTKCRLLGCLFSHKIAERKGASQAISDLGLALATDPGVAKDEAMEPPRKRRRVEHDSGSSEGQPEKTSTPRSGKSGMEPTSSPMQISLANPPAQGLAASITRKITPPSLRDNPKGSKANGADKPSEPTAKSSTNIEPLNPRMMGTAPAAHAVRAKLLNLLHDQMARLDKDLRASSDAALEPLRLSPQELITEALDVEQRIAQESSAVYPNVLKLRIVALRKMTVDGWKAERLAQIARGNPPEAAPKAMEAAKVMTGLSPTLEIAFLPQLLTPLEKLSQYGYIPVGPTDADIKEARAGVESAQGWEVCDRCQSRFQVFPGRRESDGALTGGGKCTHHWGKARRPPKDSTNAGQRETLFSCCLQAIGADGCTTAETHVFKVSEAKRLALIMPFECTPPNPSLTKRGAVSFDCEMGYTSLGLELIRLTATDWPSGDPLVDVLVRPLGEILDLNSRFSGVWPADYTSAIPSTDPPAPAKAPDASDGGPVPLPIVPTPAHARSLLLKHLTPETPLIGHAIDNDLNAVRLIHPTIVDTVLLYPHPRGLPIRYGLKMLAKTHLGRDIQMGGDQGHDSNEDALATGELVRAKVREAWAKRKREGWRIGEGTFVGGSPGR